MISNAIQAPNLNFLSNNYNNFNTNPNVLPNNYNMYNNFSSNLNYNIPPPNIMDNNVYNPYGLNNDPNAMYNQNPYQYLQGAPINNINRNLIHSNPVANLNLNPNLNNPNYAQFNSYNPIFNNVAYQTPVYPISNIPYNPNNQMDLMRNNSIMSNQPNLLNTNSTHSKRELDKMRSISSKYRGDMSAINEISNQDNYSYASNVQNTSKTNNFNKNRGNSNTGTMVNGVYKPYSLEDYKKIANVKIELGSLGPNIGTKEWEERQEKMKKMEVYANKVKGNKLVIKLKKETPIELVEKEKINKKENSNRNKAYKYDSLVREKIGKINSNNNFNPNYEYEEGDSKNVDVSGILNKYNKENNEIKYNYKEFNDNNQENYNSIDENNHNPIKRNRSSGRIRNINSLNQNNNKQNNNQQDDNQSNNFYNNMNENKFDYLNKNTNDNLFPNNNEKNDFIQKRNILTKIEDEFKFENNMGDLNIYNSDQNNNNINFRIKEVENESEIEKIQRQRQALASKINEIKESFL